MWAEPGMGWAMISYLPIMKRLRSWRPGWWRAMPRISTSSDTFFFLHGFLGLGGTHDGCLGGFRLAAEHLIAQRDHFRFLKPLRIGAQLLHLRFAQRLDSVLGPVHGFFPHSSLYHRIEVQVYVFFDFFLARSSSG